METNDYIKLAIENREIILRLLEGVGLFALISTVTGNKSNNKVKQFFLSAINILGANFGKSKNFK